MISFCLGVDWVPWHRFKTNIYLLKVNNIYTRIRCGICSKLTMNSTERYQWRRNDLFIDNFEHVSLFILVFLLLNLSMFLFELEYSTFPVWKNLWCKLTSPFTKQWSWLRNENSHFQMYACLHSFTFCENLSYHWWRGWFSNSVLCDKVQVKIKPYKGIVQYSKNQTIKKQRFYLARYWAC